MSSCKFVGRVIERQRHTADAGVVIMHAPFTPLLVSVGLWFVGSRRELVANCVHTADADATKQLRRVGGVYWAIHTADAIIVELSPVGVVLNSQL